MTAYHRKKAKTDKKLSVFHKNNAVKCTFSSVHNIFIHCLLCCYFLSYHYGFFISKKITYFFKNSGYLYSVNPLASPSLKDIRNTLPLQMKTATQLGAKENFILRSTIYASRISRIAFARSVAQ